MNHPTTWNVMGVVQAENTNMWVMWVMGGRLQMIQRGVRHHSKGTRTEAKGQRLPIDPAVEKALETPSQTPHDPITLPGFALVKNESSIMNNPRQVHPLLCLPTQ